MHCIYDQFYFRCYYYFLFTATVVVPHASPFSPNSQCVRCSCPTHTPHQNVYFARRRKRKRIWFIELLNAFSTTTHTWMWYTGRVHWYSAQNAKIKFMDPIFRTHVQRISRMGRTGRMSCSKFFTSDKRAIARNAIISYTTR